MDINGKSIIYDDGNVANSNGNDDDNVKPNQNRPKTKLGFVCFCLF